MVGRLVQQQHVRAGHQRLCQGHAFFGAARKVTHPRCRVEVQALQRFFNALLPVPSVIGLNLRLQRIQIQIFSAGQILVAHGNHMGQTVRRCVKNRRLGVQIRFLRHIGNASPLLHVPRTIVGLCQPAQDLEQGRFPCAIAPDQAHPLAGFQRKSSVVQQGHMPEG